jgi:hypothetical protein
LVEQQPQDAWKKYLLGVEQGDQHSGHIITLQALANAAKIRITVFTSNGTKHVISPYTSEVITDEIHLGYLPDGSYMSLVSGKTLFAIDILLSGFPSTQLVRFHGCHVMYKLCFF